MQLPRAVPAVLEERDCGSTDGEGVRLDLRLVLAVAVRLPVAVDARAHDLAVAVDAVASVDGDDVAPWSAGDPVDAAVVLGRDPVVATTRDDAVGALFAREEVPRAVPRIGGRAAAEATAGSAARRRAIATRTRTARP